MRTSIVVRPWEGGIRRAALAVSLACLFAIVAAPLARAAAPERAYEMVSPVDKGTAGVRAFSPGTGPIQSWAGGNAIVYPAQSAFPGAESAPLLSTMMAKRTSTGWSNIPLDPPESAPNPGETELHDTLAVSEDQTHSFVYSWRKLTPQAVEGQSNWYVKDLETGEYEFIATSTEELVFSNTTGTFWYLGGTSNFSELEFTVKAKLTPEAAGESNTYLWTRGQGLTLVSKLPDGTSLPRTTGSQNASFVPGRNQVSADGKRVFASILNGYEAPPGPRGLYVYEHGQTRAISTVHIPGEPETPVEAYFISATPDGGRVLFEVAEPTALTPDAPARVPGDLYLADVETGELTYVSDAVFFNVFAVTEDLSTIYFRRTNFQTGGVESYVDRNGEVTKITGPGMQDPSIAESSISPDGRYLAFTSPARLTSYDNEIGPACAEGCREAYLYDSSDGSFVCASCRPDGEPPSGSAEMGLQDGENTISRHRAQTVTNDGHVFFDTPDSLVGEDSNGIRDVYEYGPEGVHLISSGTGANPSLFAEATPDGSDVFFITAQRLVAQDRDSVADMYDARIGGGFPSQTQPSEATGCALEQCGALAVAPLAPGVDSESGQGLQPVTHKQSHHKKQKHHKKHSQKSRRGHNGRKGR